MRERDDVREPALRVLDPHARRPLVEVDRGLRAGVSAREIARHHTTHAIVRKGIARGAYLLDR